MRQTLLFFMVAGLANCVRAQTPSETNGKAVFENFDAKAFFGQLHSITMAGFFSDPVYGGNRGKIGWKVLGFPGLPATYSDKIDAYRNRRYVAEPQSIADFS